VSQSVKAVLGGQVATSCSADTTGGGEEPLHGGQLRVAARSVRMAVRHSARHAEARKHEARLAKSLWNNRGETNLGQIFCRN
jgi:hypothetical protein